MEDDDLFRRRVSGCFPKYGAIFMADKFTREECFERKLLGLPPRFADFVMEIKRGMLLFLYDCQERLLFGVFEASTDGAMNIVPRAYKSTGKQFPAQVRFRKLWDCHPLAKEAFSNAIADNYFSKNKFNLGLSSDQVRRLLTMFESRKIGVPSSQSLLLRSIVVKGSNEHDLAVTQKTSVENLETLTDTFPNPLMDTGKLEESFPDATAVEDSMQDPLLETGALEEPFADPPVVEASVQDPSMDTGKVEEPLADAPALEDFIPLPPINLDERQDTETQLIHNVDEPFNLSASCLDDDVLQQAISSLFSEVGACLSNEKPKPQEDVKGQIDEHIDKKYPVKRLYSDCSGKKTSVFLRLSGLSKIVDEKRQNSNSRSNDKGKTSIQNTSTLVAPKRLLQDQEMIEEENHRHSQMYSAWEILMELEKNHKIWKKGSADRDASNHEPNSPKSRKSVFSRLNVVMPLETKERDRFSYNKSKCVTTPERKRKRTMEETASWKETVLSKNEEMSDRASRNRKKQKINTRNCSGESSAETGTSVSTMLGLSQGSSASTISSGSH